MSVTERRELIRMLCLFSFLWLTSMVFPLSCHNFASLAQINVSKVNRLFESCLLTYPSWLVAWEEHMSEVSREKNLPLLPLLETTRVFHRGPGCLCRSKTWECSHITVMKLKATSAFLHSLWELFIKRRQGLSSFLAFKTFLKGTVNKASAA